MPGVIFCLGSFPPYSIFSHEGRHLRKLAPKATLCGSTCLDNAKLDELPAAVMLD